MSVVLSVIVPAHDPRMDYLESALEALRAQTLAVSDWELVVVDNKSETPLQGRLDLSWHPRARIVREDALGLTRARVTGFQTMQGEVAVLVDDDNVLAPDYLEQVMAIAGESPHLGVWGGAIRPRFEAPELAPPPSLFPLLTLRAADQDLWSNDIGHHASTPWGAGLCVRRAVASWYAQELRSNPHRQALDLQGKRLLYGGDTDIAYTGCRMGLAKGVFARLKLEHLIPVSRCSAEYLCRVAEGRGYSEVLHELALNGQLPAQSNSAGAWLRRQYHLMGLSSLERAAMYAQQRGRRQALRELAHVG